MEITSVHWCMNNRILCSHKKEGTICNNLDRPWGHYARWNNSDRKTNTMWYHLYAEYKKNKPRLIDMENTLVALRVGSCGVREMGEGGQWYQLLVIRRISLEDVMYSMVTLVNITRLYTWKMLKRVDLLITENFLLWWWTLTNLLW